MNESGRGGPVIADDTIDRAIIEALRGQELSGFEIWRWLGSAQGIPSRLTEAHLYPTLYRLEAEGQLQSDWQAGERTRRKYRPTARALERADEPDWSPAGSRVNQSQFAAPDRAPRRLASPDPEAGSWFMPRETAPPVAPGAPWAVPAASVATPPATSRIGRHAKSRPQTPSEPSPAPGGDGRPGRADLAAYADDLGARLDLPRIERDRVRQEIADHLADSAGTLEQQGYGPEAAASEAISRLGSPRDEATLIEQAEQSPGRLNRAIRRGLLLLVAEMLLWLFFSIGVLVVAPGITDMVVSIARAAGLHLAVLESAEWGTNQVAIMACLGAFAAGRLSMGQLARISRHRDATLRRPWAVGGAAGVLTLVLLLPGYQDALTVATLLVAPVAFVAGTLRPRHANESVYSRRGAAAGILLVAIVTLLPCGRMFAYDPNATPGTPLARGGGTVELTVFETDSGSYEYGAPPSNGTGVITVELWPASTEGPFIVVDPSATAATISVKPGIPNSDTTVAPSGAQSVDFTKLPPYRQWWVVAVDTAPSGQRTALDVVIQTGASPMLSNALSWLVSKL
jgi:DNA-binding PadR family transcriptional regulator